MPTPCEQAESIKNINLLLVRMEQTASEDRHERRSSEKRLMEVLEKMADQRARIDHLEQNGERHSKEAEILFERVRDTELTLASDSPATRAATAERLDRMDKRINLLVDRMDKVCRILGFISHKYAVYAYVIIIALIGTGTVIDFICHKEQMVEIITILKP